MEKSAPWSEAEMASGDKSAADCSNKYEQNKEEPRTCCLNIKMFTAILCLLSCINGAIAASYLPAVITTMEQRFELSSFMSGLIISSYEVGATIAVIFVSFLGHHGHIPLILGWGTLIIGIGSAVFSLPHFISPNYTEEYVLNHQAIAANPVNSSFYCSMTNLKVNSSDDCIERDVSNAGLYISVFVIAQTLIGIGSTPILTIGLSYIDNNVSRTASATYIAFVHAGATVGAVIGFGCGAAMLEIYIDAATHNPSSLDITSNDEIWLGAWWAGFLVFAALVCIIAPCFCIYPKTMQKASSFSTTSGSSSADDDNIDVNPSAGLSAGKLKELPRSLWKLMKNPVYMLVNIGGVFEMIIVTGFLTFAPKYLETQFYIKKSNASLITGGVAIPSAVLGIVFIGYFIKRFNLGSESVTKWVLVLNFIALCCFAALFMVGCDNIDIAGVTTSYHSNKSLELANPNPSLEDSCNGQCECNDKIYNPLCYGEMTYVSYCHAGCADMTGQPEDCSCTKQAILSFPSTIEEGECKSTCKLLPAFLVLLSIACFALAATKTPVTMVTLRCVDDELKSFGLGIQVVILRLLALLPAPILYGGIIDSSCLWWKMKCGERQNCLIHDNNEFRLRFTGISFGFHALCMFMFFMAWLVLRRNNKDNASDANSAGGYESNGIGASSASINTMDTQITRL